MYAWYNYKSICLCFKIQSLARTWQSLISTSKACRVGNGAANAIRPRNKWLVTHVVRNNITISADGLRFPLLKRGREKQYLIWTSSGVHVKFTAATTNYGTHIYLTEKLCNKQPLIYMHFLHAKCSSILIAAKLVIWNRYLKISGCIFFCILFTHVSTPMASNYRFPMVNDKHGDFNGMYTVHLNYFAYC